MRSYSALPRLVHVDENVGMGVVGPRDARYALTAAANRFLFVALPLRHPDSRSALAAFMNAAAAIPLGAADRHAVLITVLGVLNPHTGGRLPTLLDHYLSESAGRIGQLDVFEACVEEAIRYRGVGDRRIEQAVRLIESRFAEATFGPASIADAVHLEASTFSRLFKQHTGLTPTRYLRNVRLDRAAFRLATIDESIKEIWIAVGYNDGANFSNDFHEKFGVSPTEYRSRSHAEGAAGVAAPAGDGPPEGTRGNAVATVLVVDDDPVLCETTRRLLQRSGFAVLTASDGKSGLAQVNRTTVDVILLDHRLPDMDGMDVLRTLRRHRPGPKPAVALFTADWTVEDHAAEIVALNAGLVFKLCDFETLERLVRSYCDLPVKAA